MADVEYLGDDELPQRRSVTEAEVKVIARQAARGIIDEAIEQTFVRLGIDISKAESVLEFQADQRFMRRARKSSEETGSHLKKVGIGAFVLFLATVLGLGLRAWLKQNGVAE